VSSTLEKSIPTVQAKHTVSVDAVPSAVTPDPIGHDECSAQAEVASLASENVVPVQSAHTVFNDVVPLAVTPSP